MWEERYSQAEYVYGKHPNDFLAENVQHIPQGRVLCLAEGEGRNAVFLAEQGYDVLAVDASRAGLVKAQALASERQVNIETVVSDLADFDIAENSYHGVVSIFCHLPMALRSIVHEKVARGLRPGGVLILEAYTPDQLKYKTGGPPVEELTMRLVDLKHELAGLKFVSAIECARDIQEGVYHQGMGAVVQLIAKKP